MKVRPLAVTLVLASVAAAALAAEPMVEATSTPDSTEQLAVTMRLETVDGSELLGSEFDWIHRGPEGVVTLGISSSRIADSRWTYVKAGAATKLAEKTLASGAVDLGEGEHAGGSYGYRKIRARITHLPVPDKLQLYAEAQYYAVERFHGTLLSSGASYRFRPAVVAGLGYSEVIAGNTQSRMFFGRVDLGRRLGCFAGFAHGTQAPDLGQVALGLRPDADYREVYVGVSVPVRSQRLLVLVDLAEHGETRRRAIVASWRLAWPGSKRGAGG